MANNTNRLIMLIGATSRAIRAQSQSIKKTVPLSFLQIEALRYIKEHERPFMREVADYMIITPPSATFLIDGLVNSNMLKRHIDPKDRRAVRISITPRGLRMMDEASGQMKQNLNIALKRLTKNEADTFIKLFGKLSKAK